MDTTLLLFLPIFTGSWEGDIRIWKLDSKLKSFGLVGTVPAPGVVNSLQLLSPSKEFIEQATWATTSRTMRHSEIPSVSDSTSAKTPKTGTLPVLLVAGIGQEHRLGRWLSVKKGVVNCTIVVAFTPRTSV
jgi:ribosomal RNA-processing protein 9